MCLIFFKSTGCRKLSRWCFPKYLRDWDCQWVTASRVLCSRDQTETDARRCLRSRNPSTWCSHPCMSVSRSEHTSVVWIRDGWLQGAVLFFCLMSDALGHHTFQFSVGTSCLFGYMLEIVVLKKKKEKQEKQKERIQRNRGKKGMLWLS